MAARLWTNGASFLQDLSRTHATVLYGALLSDQAVDSDTLLRPKLSAAEWSTRVTQVARLVSLRWWVPEPEEHGKLYVFLHSASEQMLAYTQQFLTYRLPDALSWGLYFRYFYCVPFVSMFIGLWHSAHNIGRVLRGSAHTARVGLPLLLVTFLFLYVWTRPEPTSPLGLLLDTWGFPGPIVAAVDRVTTSEYMKGVCLTVDLQHRATLRPPAAPLAECPNSVLFATTLLSFIFWLGLTAVWLIPLSLVVCVSGFVIAHHAIWPRTSSRTVVPLVEEVLKLFIHPALVGCFEWWQWTGRDRASAVAHMVELEDANDDIEWEVIRTDPVIHSCFARELTTIGLCRQQAVWRARENEQHHLRQTQAAAAAAAIVAAAGGLAAPLLPPPMAPPPPYPTVGHMPLGLSHPRAYYILRLLWYICAHCFVSFVSLVNCGSVSRRWLTRLVFSLLMHLLVNNAAAWFKWWAWERARNPDVGREWLTRVADVVSELMLGNPDHAIDYGRPHHDFNTQQDADVARRAITAALSQTTIPRQLQAELEQLVFAAEGHIASDVQPRITEAVTGSVFSADPDAAREGYLAKGAPDGWREGTWLRMAQNLPVNPADVAGSIGTKVRPAYLNLGGTTEHLTPVFSSNMWNVKRCLGTRHARPVKFEPTPEFQQFANSYFDVLIPEIRDAFRVITGTTASAGRFTTLPVEPFAVTDRVRHWNPARVHVEEFPFPVWARGLNKAKAAGYARQHNGFFSGRCHLADATLFIKLEQCAARTDPNKPRGIQGTSWPITARWHMACLQHAIAAVLDGNTVRSVPNGPGGATVDFDLLYTCGLTSDEVAAEIARPECNGKVHVECDLRAFDGSFGRFANSMECRLVTSILPSHYPLQWCVYHPGERKYRMVGAPRLWAFHAEFEQAAVLTAGRVVYNVAGQLTTVARYVVDSQRRSGDPQTSCCNSIWTGLVHVWASATTLRETPKKPVRVSVMVLGDDSISKFATTLTPARISSAYSRGVTETGHEPSLVTTNFGWEFVSFCSRYIYWRAPKDAAERDRWVVGCGFPGVPTASASAYRNIQRGHCVRLALPPGFKGVSGAVAYAKAVYAAKQQAFTSGGSDRPIERQVLARFLSPDLVRSFPKTACYEANLDMMATRLMVPHARIRHMADTLGTMKRLTHVATVMSVLGQIDPGVTAIMHMCDLGEEWLPGPNNRQDLRGDMSMIAQDKARAGWLALPPSVRTSAMLLAGLAYSGEDRSAACRAILEENDLRTEKTHSGVVVWVPNTVGPNEVDTPVDPQDDAGAAVGSRVAQLGARVVREALGVVRTFDQWARYRLGRQWFAVGCRDGEGSRAWNANVRKFGDWLNALAATPDVMHENPKYSRMVAPKREWETLRARSMDAKKYPLLARGQGRR
jgi:hypothetical protein